MPRSDTGGQRTLAGIASAGATMTVENCIAFCSAASFIYAGVEYGVSEIQLWARSLCPMPINGLLLTVVV